MPPPPRALSIVVPAYNEEARLTTTVAGVLHAAAVSLDEYEVIVVDDGSTDGTAAVADVLAAAHEAVTAIHHPTNRGVGAAYWSALQAARHPFLTLVPGDGAFEEDCLPAFFRAVGRADMIISYRANPAARTPVRRALSVVCTTLLRLATRVPLRDGHSLYIWPVEKARRVRVPLDYRYHLTTLCALLPQVSTYAELPVRLTPKPDAFSRVLRPKVVFGLGWAMLRILARNRLGAQGERPLGIRLDETGKQQAGGATGKYATAE